jgi:hypothetical protein
MSSKGEDTMPHPALFGTDAIEEPLQDFCKLDDVRLEEVQVTSMIRWTLNG